MIAGLQQGDADGLCGLYAFLNFLADNEDWKQEEPSAALGYLLRTVDDHGWLTPFYLIDGFQPWQLKRIIDDQFENYRMPWRTVHLPDAFRASGESFHQFAGKIIDRGGAILGGPDAAHWLLLTVKSGKRVTINSADRSKPIKAFDRRCHEWNTYGGIVILPTERPSVVLD